ncbi:hypothetical protein FRC10_002199 [Ceratobasidium sp. 414]|nr:hypothetical protein FRC10_002199 [Ceratobasidium sp. 414]
MVQVLRPLDVHARLDAALVQPNVSPSGNIPANPPAYHATSPTPTPACAPAYTAQPSPTERVISRTDSGAVRAPSNFRADRRPLPEAFVNKSSRLVLDLGRRVWTSRTPVYGANAVISGKVLVKKADHALNIYVTLEGVCQTTIIERGMPVAQFKATLVHQTHKLWSNESREPLQSSYDFSLSLPTYSQGGTEVLPPSSYHAFLTRGYVEVKYCVRVDMTRARFHRHETQTQAIAPKVFWPHLRPASEINVRVSRETTLGSGEIWRVEEGEEGAECARVVTGCVMGGTPEAETSWVVEGVFKVEASLDGVQIRVEH